MQLTVKDVAKLLNVPEKTVKKMIQQGDLPAYRVHDQFRFHRTELLEWAVAKKINISADLFDDTVTSMPVCSLTTALKAGGVFYQLKADDKTSALRAMVSVLHLPDDVDRGLLLKVLLAREDMASTGLGGGIAIPHVRNPIVLQVATPQITLCFLEKPVDFNALDGKPVFALFSLITPTVKAHLYLLSRLAFALRDTSFKKLLHKQATSDEILSQIQKTEALFSSHEASSTEDGR